ncbi:hypothetical protein NUH87_00690 [Pseudomonas batumici]|uniref:hypothetical protein n=1 Tax=Pseudomonas batumici TaxID=226910 RepID=UPI0030D36D48
MDINLLTESMLGYWEGRSGIWQCEYQFGQLLIYVEHRKGERLHERLVAAQRIVQAVWDDLPEALAFAEQLCKPRMPDLWRLYERNAQMGSPLYVFSIHFCLDDPHPSYSVSMSPEFDWDRLVIDVDEKGQEHAISLAQYEPADTFWLNIQRVGHGNFRCDD